MQRQLIRALATGAAALLFAGCSGPIGLAQAQGLTSPVTAAAPQAGLSSAQQAVEQVIQKANQEQQQAFAQNNPALMRDTASDDYYYQMVQTNQGLASSGVTSIKLVNLQWGNVTVNGNSAQVSTRETWRTTYQDGTTDDGTDPNVYTLTLNGGSWVIVSDDQSGSQIESPAPTPATVPGSSVTTPSAATPTRDQSSNWSGYAATGGKFTSVTGTWTVPQPAAGSSGADATWVGIGGVNSRDLIQAGTQTETAGDGHVQYSAWIETLPQASKTVPMQVNPGDSVTVTLNEQSAGQWLVTMKDNTTGELYTSPRTYTSSESSAEWVEEAPTAGRGLVPLDGFGTVQFSGGSAVENGKTVSIHDSGAQPITMIDQMRQPVAAPSALGSDGSSFSVSQLQTATQPVPVLVPGAGFGTTGRGSGRAFAGN